MNVMKLWYSQFVCHIFGGGDFVVNALWPCVLRGVLHFVDLCLRCHLESKITSQKEL